VASGVAGVFVAVVASGVAGVFVVLFAPAVESVLVVVPAEITASDFFAYGREDDVKIGVPPPYKK
jgi:hypothetical protein